MNPPSVSSRRNFLKVAGSALGLAALGRTSSTGAAEAAPGIRLGRTVPRRFVIDCHMHFQARPQYFNGMMVAYQNKNMMACVNAWRKDYPAVLQGVKDHPETIIPFGRLAVDDPNVMDDLNYFAANGCRGIKLRDPRYNWDDERYFPIYEQIDRRGWPLLFHTGIAGIGTLGFARMRPEYLLTIAAKFTKLQIIGAHFGNPWYDAAAEVARWCPNVHFDITGSTLIKKAGNLKSLKEYLWWEGPTMHSDPNAVPAFEKIVFGTDEPPENVENMLTRYEDMFDACMVPEEIRRKVFGLTMAKILGIPVRA